MDQLTKMAHFVLCTPDCGNHCPPSHCTYLLPPEPLWNYGSQFISSSGMRCSTSWIFGHVHPLPITPRWMANQNRSTSCSNNACTASWTITKIIGLCYSHSFITMALTARENRSYCGPWHIPIKKGMSTLPWSAGLRSLQLHSLGIKGITATGRADRTKGKCWGRKEYQ